MPTFDSNGVPIHFEVHGEGMPVVFVHGLTVSFERNFRRAGWVEPMNKAGFQVIGLDLRGHGVSGKPHAQDAYGLASYAADVLRLRDFLKLDRPGLIGYSLGGHIALYLAAHHGEQFGKIVVGGIGDAAIGHGAHTHVVQQIMDALDADDPQTVADPTIRMYRTLADESPNDLRALRAAAREPFANHDVAQVRAIRTPVLVIVGGRDDVAGSADALAAAIPGAQFVVIPERNHFNAVGDYRYINAVISFLKTP